MRFRFVFTLLVSVLLAFVCAQGAFAFTYTVVSGDSLYKIGQRFGVSVAEIQAASGLGYTSAIRPGQQLSIPSGNTYVVQKGDSLFTIARNYGVAANDIMRANGLTGSTIMPGQRLSIPSGRLYTVRSGDSLFTIARNYGLTANDIMRENGLAGSTIVPGQQLRIPSPTATAATTSRGLFVSPRDFDALARLITSEADCQIHEVKVAVGAVVLNRVLSPLFPNNIYDVVYDRTGGVQFEPVLNGWINRPATSASIRAAEDALRGWDPSFGATFFFEPWVTNKFLHSLPVARKLGAFTFAYSG